jgi:sugar lactone lactonase YvrE
MDDPDGLAVDPTGLYVDEEQKSTIERFSLKACGDAAPLAVISGKQTDLSGPNGLTIGPSGSVWVATFAGHVLEYAAKANRDARPLTDINGSNTELSLPVWAFAIAGGSGSLRAKERSLQR